MHILGAIAEFERGRIVERVRAGIARARAQGKRLGRQPYDIASERFEAVDHLSLRDAAQALAESSPQSVGDFSRVYSGGPADRMTAQGLEFAFA